jgi:nucleoside-diphosphate-sugar epimerase
MDADDGRPVLVTGGRGFIGRAVGKLLQRRGYEVVSLDMAPLMTRLIVTGPPKTRPAVENELLCDLTDAASLQHVFETRHIGGMIHLAAILPTAAQHDPVRATQVNVMGSLHLLELAQRFEVKRFVFGSSLSVYGTCSADRFVSEADRAAPEDLYGAAKLYVEQLGEAYRQSHGLEFTSLRIGRVVGTGAESATSAWRSEIFEKLASTDASEILLPYVGSERILLVHVDDVAKMLVSLLQAACPAHGVYNAVCESVIVSGLKHEVERLNSNVRVRLGEKFAGGNPRLLNSNRFQEEFGFQTRPVFAQLRSTVE